MTQYSEYHDYFMNTIYKMTDSSNVFWKEKYIAGLPTLFGKKVKEKLHKNVTGEIIYQRHTLGDLHQVVNQVGLELCNNMKLEKKIKTEQYLNKKEMGDFCDQFDPFKEKRKNSKKNRQNKKDNIYQRKGKKPFNKPYNKNYKKPNYKKSKSQNKPESSNKKPTSKDKCYKCGKSGHFANTCYKNKNRSYKKGIKAILEQLNELMLSSSENENENEN